MPFKWNDTTERMMLLKFLEQNPGVKLDVQAALNDWPAGLDAPTERSIKDRFNLLKKQLRDSTVASSLGQGSASTVMAPQSIPRTPGRRSLATSSTTSNKKSRTKPESEDDDDDDPMATTPSNPITASKGHSTKQFTSKLLGVKSVSAKRGTKRKGRAGDEEEEGASTTQSDVDGKAVSDEESPSESARASTFRRALPDRRSKSKTPANYAEVFEDEDDSQASETSNDDDNKKGNASLKNDRNGKGKAKGYGKSKHRLDQGESTEDSDGLFDPRAHRGAVKDSTKGRKATWKERVAAVNDSDGADDEDMQD